MLSFFRLALLGTSFSNVPPHHLVAQPLRIPILSLSRGLPWSWNAFNSALNGGKTPSTLCGDPSTELAKILWVWSVVFRCNGNDNTAYERTGGKFGGGCFDSRVPFTWNSCSMAGRAALLVTIYEEGHLPSLAHLKFKSIAFLN